MLEFGWATSNRSIDIHLNSKHDQVSRLAWEHPIRAKRDTKKNHEKLISCRKCFANVYPLRFYPKYRNFTHNNYK